MTAISRSALASLVLVLLTSAQGARADAVPDTTLPTCPAGAVPTRDHSVTYCAPAPACGSDADCSTGHCEATSFCLGDVHCGGDSEPDCRHAAVEGTCPPGGTCPTGACETARRCVAGPVARPVSTCAVAGPRTGAPARTTAWTATAALGILLARARRGGHRGGASRCR